MKKKAPKLSLSRETLVHLSNPQLEGAAGAVPETRDKSCLLSCRAGCSAVGCTDTCPPSIVQTGCTC
jgi:predicted metal-binding protein